jgi:hypothetical protein
LKITEIDFILSTFNKDLYLFLRTLKKHKNLNMKRIFLSFIFISLLISANAQNIQLHYDMGEGRKFFTTTVEMFKPDKFGSTFFFIDMDYGSGGAEGVSLAYWEIARVIKPANLPVGFHAEYNGGMGQFFVDQTALAYTIHGAWLAGLDYSWNAADFSKGFSVKPLYKYIRGKHDAAYQLTGVWYYHFAGNKLSFTGFADFWREDMIHNFATPQQETTKFVLLAEPQLWYNFNPNFAVGSEMEFSNNFGGMKGFNVMPTIGAKVTF